MLGVSSYAGSDCTGTINSMAGGCRSCSLPERTDVDCVFLLDVAAAVQCTTVVLNSFTVPAGQTLDLKLLAGTTVNMSASFCFSIPFPISQHVQRGRWRHLLRKPELGRTPFPSQVSILSPRVLLSPSWDYLSGDSVTCKLSSRPAVIITYS